MNQAGFKLEFSICYETKIGEAVYVIGNIKELGEWNLS